MKPSNFPERKNRRRKIALENEVLDRIIFLEAHPKIPRRAFHLAKALEEADVLRSRIVPSARHERTKKNRAGSVIGAKKRQE
jgi:hypothetical protein